MGNHPSALQEVTRVLDTSVASLGALSRIVTDSQQAARLGELISKHDFPVLLRALTSRERLPADFFPTWIRRAGGYFPKFAQVLSVRADLIDDPEVLAGLSRCLEDMPKRPNADVVAVLEHVGWHDASAGLGQALNAGTVAQVNQMSLYGRAVLKVTFPDVQRRFVTDFRLFSHAQAILRALNLQDDKAQIVGAMFEAVGKSEGHVLREFDLTSEAKALWGAQELLAEWPSVYESWTAAMTGVLERAAAAFPPHLLPLLQVAQEQSRTWRIGVPTPVADRVAPSALVMTHAGGRSLQELAEGGPAAQQEAALVFLGFAVPYLGWLLLCKSSSHFAHVDPHFGNFRWERETEMLWVLDWGSTIQLDDELRRSLCLLVSCLAAGGEVRIGVSGDDDVRVAQVVRGLFNATSQVAAQESIENAAADHLLQNIRHEVVPVVRCLAILGGTLKMIQQRIRADHHQRIPLSLAMVWDPFATQGFA
ncbi:unnamed protein product [Symbiodinium sp. CCMP2592]|nr:unnamed protein product [Symbiodinium sp. CCMP2592]